MLFGGTPEQADAALRAMRHVATAGDAHPLSDPDRAALIAAHHLVFLDRDLDPDSLDDIAPDDLAAVLTKREDAEHVAGYLAVMALDAWLTPYVDHPDPELHARYKFAGATTGSLDPRKFFVSWDRGDDTAGDMLSPLWDFWEHVHEPLGEVRHAMRVPALDPGDAADGRYRDWYKPTA